MGVDLLFKSLKYCGFCELRIISLENPHQTLEFQKKILLLAEINLPKIKLCSDKNTLVKLTGSTINSKR